MLVAELIELLAALPATARVAVRAAADDAAYDADVLSVVYEQGAAQIDLDVPTVTPIDSDGDQFPPSPFPCWFCSASRWWRNGRYYGYPRCCVAFFCVVYGPLMHAAIWRYATDPAPGIVRALFRFCDWWATRRGNGWIPCPYHAVRRRRRSADGGLTC